MSHRLLGDLLLFVLTKDLECHEIQFNIVRDFVLDLTNPLMFIVYYESRKRELERRLVNEGRYDERLKATDLGSFL